MEEIFLQLAGKGVLSNVSELLYVLKMSQNEAVVLEP